MFDESLLDDPGGLARADTSGLLMSAASAGARVRAAARHAEEAGVGDLKPEGRPRGVLVAGPGSLPGRIADLLDALAAAPVLPVPSTGRDPAPDGRRWTLPGWAGPLDLLLLVTDDGTEPGLVHLVEQAYRRGCTAAAVAPAGSPLTGALTQTRGLAIRYAPAPYGPPSGAGAAHPGDFWGLLIPLLALADRTGLLAAPPEVIQALADRLDEVAERLGPTAETYRNPAKTLAAELAEALPLIWSEGPLGAAAARRFAALVTSRAGTPALAAALPDALDDHAALLAGPGRDGATGAEGTSGTGSAGGAGGESEVDLDDFFRDRVEDVAASRPRIVLLREPGGSPSADSANAARRAADEHGTAFSALDAPPGSTAESLAELLSITDFASAYLALATAGARHR